VTADCLGALSSVQVFDAAVALVQFVGKMPDVNILFNSIPRIGKER
jgi:hypothetical protein